MSTDDAVDRSAGSTTERPAALLEVRNLRTHIQTERGVVKAVDGVSFRVERGQTLGLVGESGSGKSMTCLSIMRLLPERRVSVDGEVLLNGQNLLALDERRMRSIRGRQIGMILQDPLASLNPALRIGFQVSEPLRIHQGIDRQTALNRSVELLSDVSIPEPRRRVTQYPHQMSGGMRQRVVGAAAISCSPELLLADEPTTSLDVTTQAQYLRLLERLQSELNAAMIFVTHDLGIVLRLCDRVAVMYAGRVVETGPTEEVFSNPKHPYTVGLLECLPSAEAGQQRLATIEGRPPDMADLPPGCNFAPRCPLADDRCRSEEPSLEPVSETGEAACWHRGELKTFLS